MGLKDVHWVRWAHVAALIVACTIASAPAYWPGFLMGVGVVLFMLTFGWLIDRL
jgi:hypothetical protein